MSARKRRARKGLQDFLVDDEQWLQRQEAELEKFGNPNDLDLDEGGAIVDGNGNPLIRLY